MNNLKEFLGCGSVTKGYKSVHRYICIRKKIICTINLIALNLSGLFSDFLLLQWYIPLRLFGLVNFDLMFSIVPVLAISARAKSKSNSSVHKLAKYQLGFSLAPPSSFSIVKKYVVFQARLYSTNFSEVPLKYMLMLRKISSKLSKRIKEKPGFYR